jgi:hypothetical protein
MSTERGIGLQLRRRGRRAGDRGASPTTSMSHARENPAGKAPKAGVVVDDEHADGHVETSARLTTGSG